MQRRAGTANRPDLREEQPVGRVTQEDAQAEIRRLSRMLWVLLALSLPGVLFIVLVIAIVTLPESMLPPSVACPYVIYDYWGDYGWTHAEWVYTCEDGRQETYVVTWDDLPQPEPVRCTPWILEHLGCSPWDD